MKKILVFLALAAFVFALAPSTLARADDDDHGRHRDWYKHGDYGDDDYGYRHDNGRHKGWYKHHDRDDYGDGNYDGDRIRDYYSHDRYPHTRHVIVVRGFDPRTRHIILYDQSDWVVAPYDVPRCRDWQWGRDRVYVYDDDSQPGWYVLLNSRLGRSVHVEFFGR